MLPPSPEIKHADKPDQSLYDWVWLSPSPTLELAQLPLFKIPERLLTLEERTRLTYERARKICDVYGIASISALPISDDQLIKTRLDGGRHFNCRPEVLETTHRPHRRS